MVNSISAMEWPEGFEVTPELIQSVIQKYNDWTAKLQESGRLVGLNKLKDEYGRTISGFGQTQTVTDGPYAETKEVIGGYWIITAANYDEAVEWARGCPTLEYGGRVEVREVEDISAMM
ncbi:MAG: transcription initiation protein [Acidobacteria bacterium]|nr:transcription initiation protein [Acidobacteriota bacterium]